MGQLREPVNVVQGVSGRVRLVRCLPQPNISQDPNGIVLYIYSGSEPSPEFKQYYKS